MPCIFCDASGPMSHEHVFPAWMRELFPEMDQVDYQRRLENLMEGGPAEEDRWTAGVFTQTVRDVCEGCNNGWMSDLEAAAKPLLSGPMTDQPRSYSIIEQHEVATWAVKTVLVAVRAAPGSQEIAPPEMHREFARRRSPLPNSIVWIGRYDGEGEWPTTFKLHGAGYEPRDHPEGEHPIKGFHAVFAVGHLALCVFGIPDGPRVDGYSNRKRRLIWPNVDGDVVWPPPDSMSETDLKAESAELPGPPSAE